MIFRLEHTFTIGCALAISAPGSLVLCIVSVCCCGLFVIFEAFLIATFQDKKRFIQELIPKLKICFLNLVFRIIDQVSDHESKSENS